MPLGVRGRAKAGAVVSIGLAMAGLSPSGCAQQPSAEQLSEQHAPIIGGQLDTQTRGIVSLLKRVQGGYFPSCTGTLLTPNLVLTAHHCVADLDSSDGQSVDCDTTTFDPPQAASTMIVSVEANVGQEGLDPYQVAEVWLPPQAGNEVCGKDIALLRLAANIPGNIAQPIAPRLDSEVNPNERFAAIGYGLQDPNDQEGETIGQRMRVNDAEVFCTGTACGADFVTQAEWIGESPVCSGDSGGPALGNDGLVVGVTSRGDPECTLGIYTSVYAWREFIVDGVFDAAAAGGYAPPTWAGEPPADFPQPMGGSSGSGGSSGTGGSTSSAGSGGASPIIAGPDGPVGGSGTASPTVDALGLACTDRCPGTYQCWAANGQPPGICVPRCGATAQECPQNYSCREDIDACVPTQSLASSGKSKDSSGCSVGGAPAPGNAVWLALLGLGVLWRRRRV